MRRKTPVYNATAAGDTAVSPPIYSCKYCDKRYLSWGVLGAYRRLFEAPGVLHNCLPPKKEYRSACDGFGDFSIPIEHYNDHRYLKDSGNAAESRSN